MEVLVHPAFTIVLGLHLHLQTADLSKPPDHNPFKLNNEVKGEIWIGPIAYRHDLRLLPGLASASP
jgi:hypothetical protein